MHAAATGHAQGRPMATVAPAQYGERVKYALHVPNFGPFGDVDALVALAADAEASGWDGFFLWDHVLFAEPDRNAHADVWVALTAIASATERIMLGPLVTPLARRLPWELARQAASLQRYSGGRLILGAGLGAPVEWDFRHFGWPTDDRVRAQRLDEGLAILRGLWTGEPFGFGGQHFRLEPVTFLPVPQPAVPIWIGGSLTRTGPVQRAARHDGFVPFGGFSVEELRGSLDAMRLGERPFDVVVTGRTEPDAGSIAGQVAPFADLATWWLEDLSPLRLGLEWEDLGGPWDVPRLRDRVLAGPPRSGS